MTGSRRRPLRSIQWLALMMLVAALIPSPFAYGQTDPAPAPVVPVPEPAPEPVTAAPTTAPPEPEAPSPTTAEPTTAPPPIATSTTGSASTTGSTSEEKPANATAKPTLAPSPTRTRKPVGDSSTTGTFVQPTTVKPGTKTNNGTDTSSSRDNSNTSGSEKEADKSVVVFVLAGIAAICALAVIVMCVLRRSRDELDDMASPLPHYNVNQPAVVGSNHSPDGRQMASGPGAANYYGNGNSSNNGSPLHVDTFDGEVDAVSMTSPEVPSKYRPSTRQSSRFASINRSSQSNHNSFVSGIGSLPTARPSHRDSQQSDMSVFSIRGESELRLNSETTDLSTDYRNSYASRLTDKSGRDTNHYRFSSELGRDLSSVSYDEVDPTRSQSIGGSDGKNWYNPVMSPTSDRMTSVSDFRTSTERQSCEL